MFGRGVGVVWVVVCVGIVWWCGVVYGGVFCGGVFCGVCFVACVLGVVVCVVWSPPPPPLSTRNLSIYLSIYLRPLLPTLSS